VRSLWIHFSAGSAFELQYISGELHAGCLHPEANTEKRHIVLSGIADSGQFAFDTALTESGGHKDTVQVGEELAYILVAAFQFFRVNRDNLYLAFIDRASVYEGLVNGFVGIRQLVVFANQTNLDLVQRIFEFSEEVLPGDQVRFLGIFQVQLGDNTESSRSFRSSNGTS
jgi:hypothetical protein